MAGHSCVSTKRVSFGFRHFGPVSRNDLAISESAKLMKSTPDATTFPSAQSQAKLTISGSCSVLPGGPLTDEPLGATCERWPIAETAVNSFQDSRAQIIMFYYGWTTTTAGARRRLPLVSSAWLSTIKGGIKSVRGSEQDDNARTRST